MRSILQGRSYLNDQLIVIDLRAGSLVRIDAASLSTATATNDEVIFKKKRSGH